MPGLESLLNHLVDRSFLPAFEEVVLFFLTEARVFSRSRVRFRKASNSVSHSSMFTRLFWAAPSQVQPEQGWELQDILGT